MNRKNNAFYLGILFFIIIAVVLMYLEKSNTPLTNKLWLILCVSGIVYYILEGFVEIIRKIMRKLKIKDIRENCVKMEIIDKYFAEGSRGYISGTKIYTKSPDAYIIKLKYNGKDYTINDKDIFESSDVGEYIDLKLIEKLDKNHNLISYKLDNV